MERRWRTACARVAAGGAGALFNGRVFSADTIAPDLMTGHLTEFRRIVAQMERPALFDALGVRPLAVCGVLRCADGMVFGRRHAGAIYQADMWQLPPAGSVDAHAVGADGAVALGRQLLSELREELGLWPDDVDAPVPLCVVEHPGSHVSRSRHGAAQRAGWRRHPSCARRARQRRVSDLAHSADRGPAGISR